MASLSKNAPLELEQPYGLPIKDLFNLNTQYWVNTVENWRLCQLKLSSWHKYDLDAEGDEVGFEDEAYDACR